MSKISPNYLQFSKLAHKVNKRYKIADSKELLALEAVLRAYVERVEFAVLDLILLNEIASQATLHSIMKGLIIKKMIKTETCQHDGRRKLLLPTKHGLS
jgi:DNA-binding MarR family transcriptional regulator